MNISYEFPDFTVHGLTAVRYYSWINQWLDFVVIFDGSKYERDLVADTVRKSMESFWDDRGLECYGDNVEYGLNESGIENYMVVYHDFDNESEEYEDAWERFLSDFKCIYEIR